MRKKLTSKKALKQLKENVYELDEWQYDRLNIIEKDLEILELLKEHIYYSAKSHCIRMSDIYKKTTSFDYEDIKEWLEDVK